MIIALLVFLVGKSYGGDSFSSGWISAIIYGILSRIIESLDLPKEK